MRVGLRTRFLLLRGLRWLATGLLLPVLVLFVLDRGLTLAQFGLAAAVQAVVILILELPTGGLADVIGARRVLIVANLADLASIAILLSVDSPAILVAVFALQGLYRSLESGPLDAWYVSGALAADPGVDIEADMARAGMVSGLAIAAGSLAASGLVIVAPGIGDSVPGLAGVASEPLTLPLVVSVALRLVDLLAVSVATDDTTHGLGPEHATVAEVLGAVPAVVAGAVKVVSGSSVLVALLGVELLWGFGLVGFETLFPPRLAEAVSSPVDAARVLGPIGAGAWLLSAAGSIAVPRLSRRIGAAVAGALLRVLQGLTVLVLALFGGPVVLVIAYLTTLAIHGASNAVHAGLLHTNAPSDHRTTVLSANSMAAHLGGGVGSVVLGALAAGLGLRVAIAVAAVALAAAAPLYLLTRSGRAGG